MKPAIKKSKEPHSKMNPFFNLEYEAREVAMANMNAKPGEKEDKMP